MVSPNVVVARSHSFPPLEGQATRPLDRPLRWRVYRRRDPSTENEEPVVTTTFKVDDIHCGSCENTIRTALSRLEGVAMVVPSAERNDVKVSFDDTRIAEERLRATLEEVGFAPVP